ncbi:cyclin-dependent kinase inhibitor 1-like [Typha angustifolia]|uniref:cyclin-dependent kinase inhibitor 1-like n=1 Tax=Typha angustifolia TaxID=59011 RepID=UPI003C2E74FE
MGKYLRKCKRIQELAAMEVTQVVGVRTRARRLAMEAAAAAAEIQISCLQLRSRSVVMKLRTARSASNSRRRGRLSPQIGRISRFSSNASPEVAAEERISRSGHTEVVGEFNSAEPYYDCNRERRQTTPSSSVMDESSDLESTGWRASAKRTTVEIKPLEAEIEEFFASAERAERDRFASKYNYDIANDAPLEGRYEWVRIN